MSAITFESFNTVIDFIRHLDTSAYTESIKLAQLMKMKLFKIIDHQDVLNVASSASEASDSMKANDPSEAIAHLSLLEHNICIMHSHFAEVLLSVDDDSSAKIETAIRPMILDMLAKTQLLKARVLADLMDGEMKLK